MRARIDGAFLFTLLISFGALVVSATKCNNLKADIVFVLDVSETVTYRRTCTSSGWFFWSRRRCSSVAERNYRNFQNAKNFLYNLIGLTEDYINSRETHAGVVRFLSGGSIHTHLNLDGNSSYQDVRTSLSRIPYQAPRYTHTSTGLRQAMNMLNSSVARENATHLVVLLTDGKGTSSSAQTEAEALQLAGKHLITVTVTSISATALNRLSGYSDYVHRSSSTSVEVFNQLVQLACQTLCTWNQDPCFPGGCGDHGLAKDCQCATGFKLSNHTEKRCELDVQPDLTTCRVTLKDVFGNEVRSRTTGSQQHCNNQQHEVMNIQSTTITFQLDGDLQQSIGALPPYVSRARVGIIGFELKIVQVSVEGNESVVSEQAVDQYPVCSATVSTTEPVPILHCTPNVSHSSNLSDGEKLCMDLTALGGGYYIFQDEWQNYTGNATLPVVSTTRRLCFTYDRSRPVHCSQVPGVSSCIGSPLELSTRLTRSPSIRVAVGGWLDQAPRGVPESSVYMVSEYYLEVHEVHVSATNVVVQEAAVSRRQLTGNATVDVSLTLPATEPALYAVILEVHDVAGNVAYARRLVLYDNSSRVVLNLDASLKVVSANPLSNSRWQTDFSRDVCLSWQDRFYNDAFFHAGFFLPVSPDRARDIEGVYDQTTGVLPVRGTPSAHGIVKFEISWRQEGNSQTSWTLVHNITAQSTCLSSLALRDGSTYHLDVRASDVMNNSVTDDVTLHLDSSRPELRERGLKRGRKSGGLYSHDSTDLSTMVLVIEASDLHSGIKTLRWTLSGGGSDDPLGTRNVAAQRLGNETGCGSKQHCYCPAVGPCEIYRYEITFNSLVHGHTHIGDHHRNYNITLNVTNWAGLVSVETLNILIDTSPPTAGVALEGQGDSGEVDFTRQNVLHVRWHGFRDEESGVEEYRVVVAGRCLSVQEVEEAGNATEVTAGSPLRATFSLPAEGRYYTNVVGYNGAHTPSSVACSDGVVYDTSPPRLLNVSIANARTARALACTSSAETEVTWLVSSDLTKKRLSGTPTCAEFCQRARAVSSVGHLPTVSSETLSEAESDELCRSLPMMTEDWWMAIPSDRLRVQWADAEKESALEDFYVSAGSSRTSTADLIPVTSTHRQHVFHNSRSGLGHGTVFFLFLRAVNKAGSSTDLILGPIVVDSTPPRVSTQLTTTVDSKDHVRVAWTQGDIVDPEQPAGVEFDITYRLAHPEGYITPFRSLSEADTTDCQKENPNVVGCLRFPLEALRSHETGPGRHFFFQLHVQNAAGLLTVANTSSLQLPPRQSFVIVRDITPSMAADSQRALSDVIKDVDVRLFSSSLCAAWTDVTSGQHETNVQVQFGAGRKENDDIIPFSLVDGSSGRACINVSSLPFYEKIYSLVRIPSTNSSAVHSSDGLVFIPRSDPQNTAEVFTGKSCSTNNLLHEEVVVIDSTPHEKNLSTRLTFHSGDILFVELQPYIANVEFSDALVIQTMLTGYQVILRNPSLSLRLPALNNVTTTSARVYSCLKNDRLWRRHHSLTASWDLSGPAVRFANYLEVDVVDQTCLQRSASQEDRLSCSVAKSHLRPSSREAWFRDLVLVTGHSYTTSVALCFEECLPGVPSVPFTVSTEETVVKLDTAQIVSQAEGSLGVNITASIEPETAGQPCYFLWSVSRTSNGSRLLSDWQLRKENQCDNIEITEQVSFTGTSLGSLYACMQPVYPQRDAVPTCRQIARSLQLEEERLESQPFHVIEMTQTQLRKIKAEDYLINQHADNRLHELYDLDLDFTGSDVVVAALVTNSFGHAVTWFLMTAPSAPDTGDCVTDPSCVTWSVSASRSNASVVFPSYRASLQSGEVYYACALLTTLQTSQTSSGRHEVCGDGFLVDDHPPSAGTVAILDTNGGFLSDEQRVVVSWSGFHDALEQRAAAYDVASLSYSVALGSSPGGEDLASRVDVGRRTLWTFHNLHLAPGMDCFATVTARDMAGHVISASSKPAIFDNTPPSHGKVTLQSYTGDTTCVSSSKLHVRWEAIADPVSGIASQEVSVGMHSGIHQNDASTVTPFLVVRGGSVMLNLSAELMDGHTYVILLKSTNGAGFTTLTASEPFVADNSPPVLGAVWVNTSASSDSDQTNQYVYTAYWSDFADTHCGLAYYRVGLGSNPSQDDVVSLHYVGLRTSYTWRIPLDSGKEYFTMVEACNHADVCSATSSSGFLVDHTPPSSGHVTIGGSERHSPFWGHSTFLEARWHRFADSHSGIREFRWCVGQSPGLCDVMAMTSAQQERQGIATNTSLPSAVPLYVTVLAENYAGLRTSATSSKFIVDVSPPSVQSPPTFLSPTLGSPSTSQSDRSVVKLSWRFTDPGSSVVTHTVSINGHRHGRHGSQPLVVMATSEHVTLQLDQESLLSDGERYTASVTACNAADLCTTAVSGTLLVDSSPPVVGKFEPEMAWQVRAVNDSVRNASYLVTELNVVWTGFADEESGIRGYHLTAGRSYSSDELSGGAVFVIHDNYSSIQTFPLGTRETVRSGDLLVFSLRAENTLGLISPVRRKTFEVFNNGGNAGTLLLQRHSCAPHYCSNECTCAPSIQNCQPSGNLIPCRELSSDPGFSNLVLGPRLGCPSCDLDFITSATCLEGHWTMPDLDSSTIVSRFQWSFSLAGNSPGVGIFDFESQPEWYDAGLRTSTTYCLPHPRTLASGSSYVLHVRAWLSRDSYVTQISPPIVVDHSPPARRRGRSVIESGDFTCGRDLDFFSNSTAHSLTACWRGVFSDQESGIQSYTVSIGTVPYGYDYQREQDLHLSTSYNIDTSSMLEGTRYYVTVRATNGAGLTLTLTSDGVVKDVTPPVTGAVYTSSRHAVSHFTRDSTSLSASWHGFSDLTSGLAFYSVALYDASDLSTPVMDFTETRLERTHRFDSLGLEQGQRYKVAVKATDAARLESLTAWSNAILVDVTPPQGITCTNFVRAAEAALIFIPTSSFLHEQYKTDLTINVPADSHLLKVALEATSLRPGARATVTLEEITMPLVFDFAFLNRSSAQHVLMSPGEGSRRVSVVVYGNAGADISAQVYTCTESAASTTSVVTLRQVSPSALSICTTVVDEESSVKTLKIGVGSTPGGLQVKGWTLAGQSGHLVLTGLSHVQQAGPLYAVVLAQNHAGAWSRFVSSQPVVFDTTPPVISGLNLTLTDGHPEQAESNATVTVTAVAVWSAVDEESGGVTCTCTIVGPQAGDDVTQLRNDVTPGYCQWHLKAPEHGSSVHAIISCRNRVDVTSTQTSNEAVILTQPPQVKEASLHSVYNYDRFSPYDRPDLAFRSSDSDLLFSLTGINDPTVHQFQYRFLLDSTPLTGWSPLPLYKTAAVLPKTDGRRGNVTAEVRALNRKGMVSDVRSMEVLLHDRKPSLTGVKATASLVNSTLLLAWIDVFSADRDVTFTLFAGSRENSGEVINHYVTKSTTYTAPCNPSVQQLYLNILCVYRNGYSELYQDKITI